MRWRTTCILAVVLAACSSAPPQIEQAEPSTTQSSSSTTSAATPAEEEPPATTQSTSTTSTSTTIPEPVVRTGAGVLLDSDFAALDGKRVGLIAHQSSVVDGNHIADLLHAAPNVTLVAMFGPEHGVRGTADAGEYVADARDPTTGVAIYSLFGPTRQPSPEMLNSVDVLVYDLQDVGARYYTYISTMGLAMQAAAAADIEFLVLERPNPLGDQVGGGMLEPERASFVGQYPIPDVYGLTSFELATRILENRWLDGLDDLRLNGVAMQGWNPAMRWAETGLDWIPPSPAITTPDTALLYPATVYFEATSLSYGRGTDMPFEVVGAPWLDAEALRDELMSRNLPGVAFEVTTITPEMLPGMTVAPAYLGETLPALKLEVTDPSSIRSAELGVHLLEVVFAQSRRIGTNALARPEWLDQLSGSTLLRGITNGELNTEEVLETQQRQREAWER